MQKTAQRVPALSVPDRTVEIKWALFPGYRRRDRLAHHIRRSIAGIARAAQRRCRAGVDLG
jgi:hypothetical protein